MPTAAAHRRRERRQEREDRIVDATRALWDAQGLQEAGVEAIARGAGIDKALIYRHFASKEELFVLTVCRYLDDLVRKLEEADHDGTPTERLEACSEAYGDFCLRHPAFLDCALGLMRRPAAELRASVSEAVWMRLGRAMAAPLGHIARLLREGVAAGAFAVEDPDFTANQLYVQGLGALQLARLGTGVRESSTGVPEPFGIEPDRVRRAMVDAALAVVGARA